MPVTLEVKSSMGSLENVGESTSHKSKVVAPRNPKLIRTPVEANKLKPSTFLKEISMTTEEKLAHTHEMRLPKIIELLDMGDTTYQRISKASIDEPLFQPFPSDIVFQKFKPFETYEVPLILRNNDKVPRLVKVVQTDSPYFKILSPPNVCNKVGPGLPSTFRILFTPEENKDYIHELVCITEREKFIVPVRAIGARAILDFPDEVMFSPGPVKYQQSKTLFVRNIGDRVANFSVTTEKPFVVFPENGILEVGEATQVTIEFRPTKVGDHRKELVIHYDTGDDIFVNLHGVAQDANVRLDKNSLKIENTFVSMANQRNITICNRSDAVVHFEWKRLATIEEEEMQKQQLISRIDDDERHEKDLFMEDCNKDPSMRDRLCVLTRGYQHKKNEIIKDPYLFTHGSFEIEPAEGDIWPNATFDVHVTFRPQEAKSYQTTAFCDITGRESRLPLRLSAQGVGPQVEFSIEELNLGSIFIGSIHSYEIVIRNKGDIDAIFGINPNQTPFGQAFNFEPFEGIILPDGYQAIHVTFQSDLLGQFSELFNVTIDGLPQKHDLRFSGSVVGPSFHLDKSAVDFGLVSYGFLSIHEFTIHNTSLVPLPFILRVRGDGSESSTQITDSSTLQTTSSSSDMMSSDCESIEPGQREINIEPQRGSVPPHGERQIAIQMKPPFSRILSLLYIP